MQRTLCAVFGILIGLAAALAVPSRNVQAGGAAVRVGLPRTFFNDVPPILVQIATEPFSAIIRDTTGVGGELVVVNDAFTVGQQLADHTLQLAVLHSFEFGWVQQKHPQLRPLMVAVNSQGSVSAYVLVRKDSELTLFAELKGKEFSLPKRTREHTRLYLEHQCHDDGSCGSRDFFGHVVGSANVETALDDLCQGKVQAAVVDAIGLEFYKDLKPGCFARLRVLAESGAFPPPVVVYYAGGVGDDVITRIQDGLRNAHKTEMGREMMKMWKLTSFEPVPENYAQAVAACLKTYPGPDVKH